MKNCKKCNFSHENNSEFCSTTCARSYSGSKSKGSKKPRSSNDNVLKICLYCKNEFIVSYNKRHQKTCSKFCAAKNRGGWTNHNKVNWPDINKKSYETGKNFVAGGTTKWIQYKNIKVQGSYEFRMCEILDELKNSSRIKNWHYSSTRIKYEFEGLIRTYIIDFTIDELDGSQRHIEVKGRETEIDKAKWAAAISQGLKLEIWRKEDLYECSSVS